MSGVGGVGEQRTTRSGVHGPLQLVMTRAEGQKAGVVVCVIATRAWVNRTCGLGVLKEAIQK